MVAENGHEATLALTIERTFSRRLRTRKRPLASKAFPYQSRTQCARFRSADSTGRCNSLLEIVRLAFRAKGASLQSLPAGDSTSCYRPEPTERLSANCQVPKLSGCYTDNAIRTPICWSEVIRVKYGPHKCQNFATCILFRFGNPRMSSYPPGRNNKQSNHSAWRNG